MRETEPNRIYGSEADRKPIVCVVRETEPNRIYGSKADRKPIVCVGEGREYAELIIGGQRI